MGSSLSGQQPPPPGYEEMPSNGSGPASPLVGKSDPASTERPRRKSTLWTVTGFIIACEFCERLAYYGFAGSLVLFFQSALNISNEQADTQYALWSGVCYVTPLLGGWIADSYLGRYRSILVFSTLYLTGLFAVTAGAVPGGASPRVVFPAMYLIALGTGGIKANVSVFGADQFDDRDPQDVREKESFFNWFYWSINLGALVSYTLVSYVCQYGLPFLGGQDWGFFVGYTIPCVAMTLAVGVFVAGAPRYRYMPPTGSVVGRAMRVVWEAGWTRAGAGPERGDHWLERAKQSHGGSFPDAEVGNVRRVWRLLPFLGLLVPYWAVYSQMSTAFQNQGCQMDLTLGGTSVPVAALNMFDTLAILLLIPVFDKGLYPWLARWGKHPSLLQRMGAGLFFSAVAVLVAAVVEVWRRGEADVAGGPWPEGADRISPCRKVSDYNPHQFQEYWDTREEADRPGHCEQVPGCETIGPDGLLDLACIACENIPMAASLSVLWQVPQFLLIGTSEILAAVTSLEFFYAEAPSSMRGLSAGLNLLTTALGSWVTIPLLELANSELLGGGGPWVPDDLNEGHLELYFLLLAGLVLISLLIFVIVSPSFKYSAVAAAAAGGIDAEAAAVAPSEGFCGDNSKEVDVDTVADMAPGRPLLANGHSSGSGGTGGSINTGDGDRRESFPRRSRQHQHVT